MDKLQKEINIYTDGSCNHEYGTGGWAAILIFDGREVLLKGMEPDTTQNRMELLSVIRALEYIENQDLKNYKIIINSDSQYVVRLIDRKDKLQDTDFTTRKGGNIKNRDLVEKILNFMESMNLSFIKVKAHQGKSDTRNYNRDVDKISRKIVREDVRKNHPV